MLSKRWTDAAILQAINGTEEEREQGLYHIFHQTEWKNSVINYIRQNGGDTQDGEDIFQEAIILLDRSIRQGNFEGKSELRTYFFAIAKRRWWKFLSRRKPTQELQPQHYDENVDSAEVKVLSEEKKNYLRDALKQIGDRCKTILELYQLDYTMAEIAAAVGLSNDAMAKKEAYRCRLRLRQYLENNPEWKNLTN